MKVKYNRKTINVNAGQTVAEAFEKEIKESKYSVLGCIINNEYSNLNTELEENDKIELLDTSTKEGIKIYRRTLTYIMSKALREVYPDKKVTVEYQIGNAMFCKCDTGKITQKFLDNLKSKMKDIVKKDLNIKKVEMTRNEAKKFYEQHNTARGRLQYNFKENKIIYMYYCEEYFNYCYGVLANKTGVIKKFDLLQYKDGFVLIYPQSTNPNKLPEFVENKKVAWSLEEFRKIHALLDMMTVYKLNTAVEENKIMDMIMLAEALHEKKIANIADEIAKKKGVKMILIAGPSSSGKTTFAQRLGIQLRLNGLKPVTISVDNYFVERQETPRDENGEYDFECIEAIDLDLFNRDLVKLLKGEEIDVPEFHFALGSKKYNGKKMKLSDDEVLVIEGIHCLNDKLTNQIPKENKFKIYISALTVLNMDRYNRISTTDTRLLRRIVRDHQFRGYTAIDTLNSWKKVTAGEMKNIFPYQEEADAIFNTSLIYEIAALKDVAMPLLKAIDNTNKEYAEAQRLINILKYFKPIPSRFVPINSLLKEFLGGGIFDLH